MYLPDVGSGKSGSGKLPGGGVMIVANSATSEGAASYVIRKGGREGGREGGRKEGRSLPGNDSV